MEGKGKGTVEGERRRSESRLAGCSPSAPTRHLAGLQLTSTMLAATGAILADVHRAWCLRRAPKQLPRAPRESISRSHDSCFPTELQSGRSPYTQSNPTRRRLLVVDAGNRRRHNFRRKTENNNQSGARERESRKPTPHTPNNGRSSSPCLGSASVGRGGWVYRLMLLSVAWSYSNIKFRLGSMATTRCRAAARASSTIVGFRRRRNRWGTSSRHRSAPTLLTRSAISRLKDSC